VTHDDSDAPDGSSRAKRRRISRRRHVEIKLVGSSANSKRGLDTGRGRWRSAASPPPGEFPRLVIETMAGDALEDGVDCFFGLAPFAPPVQQGRAAIIGAASSERREFRQQVVDLKIEPKFAVAQRSR